jgi:hypothetical protein
MRKSPENLLIVLNSMVDNPKLSVAARKIGVSTMTIYRWLKMSRDGAPEFQDVEWCGERGSFHQFYEYAQHAQINEIEQTAKHNALGFDEVVTHDGAVQYQIDPKLVGMSDEMLEDFGYPDRYLRNERGEVIPLTVKRKPSDALVIKMLSAHKPELYGERSRVDVNMRVGGVLRLQRPDEVVAKTLEQQQDGSFAFDDGADKQVTPPTSTMLALGRPAQTSEEFDRWNANKEFEAAPVTFVKADGSRTVTKAELPLPGDKPLTPLQADPLRRAQQPPAHPRQTAMPASAPAAAALAPAAKPYTARGNQAEGIGRGAVHPGGMKVA